MNLSRLEKTLLKGVALFVALCAFYSPALTTFAATGRTARSHLLVTSRPGHRGAAVTEAVAQTFLNHNKKLTHEKAREYASYVVEAGERFSVDPTLMAGIIIMESRVNAQARSKYAYGLTQVHWKVHRKSIGHAFPHIKTEQDLLKPRNNIFVGTWIFSNYLKRAGGDFNKALGRYLGSSNNNRYVKSVMGYRQRVLSNL